MMKNPRSLWIGWAGRVRIARLAMKEIRQLLRDPRTKRIIFLSPVVQLLLFGYAVNTDVRDVPLALVDRDHTVHSRALADALTASGHFRIVLKGVSEEDAESALDRGAIRAALIVPEGYGRDLLSMRSPSVQFLIDGTNSNTAAIAQGQGVKILTVHTLEATGSPGTTAAVDLRVRAWFNPELESRVYNVPAVIGMIILIMTLLLTAMSVVREREMGTLDQLLVSPLEPAEFMVGKMLPVMFVALVQLALVALVALLWFGIPFRGSVLALILASLLFILAGLSFGFLVSTISQTQQEAFLSIFLLLLPAVILSGFLYPVETMPPFFQWLTMANPFRHFLEIVRDLFLKGANMVDLWRQFSILAAMAGGGLWLATNRFRASLR